MSDTDTRARSLALGLYEHLPMLDATAVTGWLAVAHTVSRSGTINGQPGGHVCLTVVLRHLRNLADGAAQEGEPVEAADPVTARAFLLSKREVMARYAPEQVTVLDLAIAALPGESPSDADGTSIHEGESVYPD